MIKALFFDLDGTLLTSSKRFSEKTKGALKECKNYGMKIFVATARPPSLSKMLDLTVEEEDIIRDGGVFYNGGCFCCNNKKVYTCLSEETVTKCLDIILPYIEVNLAVQMTGERHSFRYGLTLNEYRLWGFDELVCFEKLKYNHVVKMVVFSPWGVLPELQRKLLNSVDATANVYFTGKKDFRSIEIVDRKINKKLAINRIMELCVMKSDEVAVFGDDFNDIEMLRGFKHSVAMGNACDEVKSCAAYVSLGNDEEGIYYALSNYLKII